jgi:hypothetical protein
MPPPATKPVAPVKATNPLTVKYYTNGAHNYADKVISVNGMMQKGEYEVREAKNGHLLTFICAVCARSFDKTKSDKIMKDDYHKSSAGIVAWDKTVLEMMEKKVHPIIGLFWGKP